jgi:serine/threonine protein kinase
MTHHIIGKVLQGRYQVVQNLGSGVFGQTYIAVDIEQPGYPKCVIKQLKATTFQPNHLESLRLRFLTETETLKRLENHEQIPQLFACFEENERFYLVQEFIDGHPLTAELPVNKHCGYRWSEREVVQFLEELLGILAFVHSQDVIHCDVKPENIIRRACDGKLFLIDFGSIQPADFALHVQLPIYKVPVTSLGYIPPEQFISQTKLSSDIYSLGMIAIEALTGQTPLQLKVDPQSNEILWRNDSVHISDYLTSVLTKMIRYDYRDRFGSASEVLQALKEIPLEANKDVIDVKYNVLQPANQSLNNDATRQSSKTSPLITGLKFGLLANSVVMGLGVYSLTTTSPAYSGTETLFKATEKFQSGDIKKAIALAQSIPSSSHLYSEAQANIEEWEQQWKIAAEKYKATEKAFNAGRWSDVIQTSAQVPDILYWQTKTDKLVAQTKIQIQKETNDLLSKAYEKASDKDFSSALQYLRQIPKESSAGALVQKKLAEYDKKQHARASFLLQQAYNRAEVGNFDEAVRFLQQIPKSAYAYTTAQAKVAEYKEKQRQQAASFRGTPSNSNTSNNQNVEPPIGSQENTSLPNTSGGNSFINGSSSTKLQDFKMDSYMNEVNIGGQ